MDTAILSGLKQQCYYLVIFVDQKLGHGLPRSSSSWYLTRERSRYWLGLRSSRGSSGEGSDGNHREPFLRLRTYQVTYFNYLFVYHLYPTKIETQGRDLFGLFLTRPMMSRIGWHSYCWLLHEGTNVKTTFAPQRSPVCVLLLFFIQWKWTWRVLTVRGWESGKTIQEKGVILTVAVGGIMPPQRCAGP